MAAAKVKFDVRVSLFGCSELRKAETGMFAGKNDPYVKFSLEVNGKSQGVRVTPHVPNAGRSAKWNPPDGWSAALETVQRTDPEDTVHLVVTVLDKNSLADDKVIGSTALDLSESDAGRTRKQVEISFNGEKAGIVDLALTLNVPSHAEGCRPGAAAAAEEPAAPAPEAPPAGPGPADPSAGEPTWAGASPPVSGGGIPGMGGGIPGMGSGIPGMGGAGGAGAIPGMGASVTGAMAGMEAAKAAMSGMVHADSMSPSGAANGLMMAGRTVHLRSSEGGFLGVDAYMQVTETPSPIEDSKLCPVPGRFLRLQSVGAPDKMADLGGGANEFRLDRTGDGCWSLYSDKARAYLAFDASGYARPEHGPHPLRFCVVRPGNHVEDVSDLRHMTYGSTLVVVDARTGHTLGLNPANGAMGAMARSFDRTSQFFVQITREVMLRSAIHGAPTGPGFIRLGTPEDPSSVDSVTDGNGVGGVESAMVIVSRGLTSASLQAVRPGAGGRPVFLRGRSGASSFTIVNL